MPPNAFPRGRRAIPKDKMLFFRGLILEQSTPAASELLTSHQPTRARLLWQVVGKLRYESKIPGIRGALDPRIPPVSALARWMNRHVSPNTSAPDGIVRFHLWLYQKTDGRIGHG
jgi:hypothetical protein